MTKIVSGRIPGPLGISVINTSMVLGVRGPFGLVPAVIAGPKAFVAKKKTTVIKLDMIEPATDNKTKEVKDVKWDLYPKKVPRWEDPQQSDVLMGCALASILSALANTPVGEQHIKKMIKPVPSGKKKSSISVEVNLKHVMGSLASSPGQTMKTKRYFNVKVGGKSYKVSSVFYTDESTNIIMIYMKSPNDALWPCVIEKAYAKHLNKNGYAVFVNFADPEQVWMDIVGAKPTRLHITNAKSDEEIKRVVKDATKTPTIATTSSHGFAVRGFSNDKVKLYDTWTCTKSTMRMPEFKNKFSDLFYGKP